MPTLLDPLIVGDLTLPNRIVMAPLTRLRAPGAGHVPNALMAGYYRLRASAGLIITEATPVTPMGVGYDNVPGIWSAEQVEGWKLVTDAVHEAGGRIVMQIWHVGRISHPYFLDGALPVAPSAVKPAGFVSLVRPQKEFVTPRALETSEIPGVVEAYRLGAENAKKAGFDGVELHAANGYLLDQFLQDKTNQRTDAYGGSIENRARLLLEATDAVVSVWGAGRVGVHLAPRGESHDIGDSNPAELFGYVASELGKRKLGFLFVREREGPGAIIHQMKRAFGGVVMANDGFTQETGEQILASGDADAVSYGKLYISNPDLVERFATDAALNEPVPTTFYAEGATGYTDYPLLPDAAQAA
ncbi:alkene reductase [Acidisphaera sp. L21]|uniref:alkene reductase n=1 Tax=Acidisphaera sp. L21 TaxID=1641851 RepID=UPI00131B3D7C|nr:alkene reductase [Acidisphaera sp. L21]